MALPFVQKLVKDGLESAIERMQQKFRDRKAEVKDYSGEIAEIVVYKELRDTLVRISEAGQRAQDRQRVGGLHR